MAASLVSVGSERKLSVLLASDREAVTRALAEAIRAQGSQPLVQESADAAAQALQSPAIDVVLIDGSLPGVNWDLVRAALAGPGRAEPEPLDAVERRHIIAALRYTRGNRRNAAQLLGIARSTLLAKIRKYGLDGDPTLARR
jgi:DNA-binding NtrC family response regulator